MTFGGYRYMWLVVLFDLPTETKQDKRAYTVFRKHLLRDGFTKMQYSVYLRHCASQENADVHTTRVAGWVPDKGEIRIVTITDKQYERMRVFRGKRREPAEQPPRQLEMF